MPSNHDGHAEHSAGCLCIETEEWASLVSRRDFLAAAALLPVAAGVLSANSTAATPSSAAEPAATSALSVRLVQKVGGGIDTDADRLVATYKDIHQNPELGFMEMRTAGIVAKELKALGFEVKTGIGKTGVVGILRNGTGPTVMYRADMDANAVREDVDVPYASKVRVKRSDGVEVPVAHMCGHDAHVTWMLGLGKWMAANKSDWKGTLILVGQPAEELIEGAKAMVDDGLYGRHNVPVPDFIVALHTAPVPTGVVAARGGTIMAGTDQIDVTFYGVGGHGSMPQLAKDPVIMAAMAVAQYQVIVSRVVNPLDTAVLTVGSIQAGTDNNVIPETALLKINLRYFAPKVREQMISGIRSINNGIASTYGMPDDKMPKMVMKGASPPLVNDIPLVTRMHVPLRQLLGEKAVITEFPPATGSEDAHLLKGDHTDIPMAFMAVGIADPEVFAASIKAGKGLPFSAHNPNFKVDLASIPLGAKVGALAVLELMATAGST